MEHTELPWTATEAPDVGILIEAGPKLIAIVDSECEDIASCDVGPANADFIVRAANNHAKLLAALEEGVEWRNKHDTYILPASWFAKARAAIEEAKK